MSIRICMQEFLKGERKIIIVSSQVDVKYKDILLDSGGWITHDAEWVFTLLMFFFFLRVTEWEKYDIHKTLYTWKNISLDHLFKKQNKT